MDTPTGANRDNGGEIAVFLFLLCYALSKLRLMHPLFEKAAGLTEIIIAAAIEVHRDKGPGLIESLYEWCLLKELELRGLDCVSQKSISIQYTSQGRRKNSANP
jgi:PD-(D/E)XK nuclease superfamily